ncbi:GerMN domain-containing protein [Specibacter sp. NPDC078692]|uniref:GerMN domain-containing protein n=1 Tax=Specibacter sp. NPDC078692 TaxID=3155818 RepID=UPI0034320D42
MTLFFIAEGDAGISGPMVGCGDSAVAVSSQTITYTDPIEGALRTLLSNHAAHIGQSGLRNALSDSRLSVDSVDRTGTTVTAHLSGTMSLAGECDIPRLEQQLLLTAQQAAGTPVAITINGKTLSEALSLK